MLHLDKELGTLETGKLADVLIVDGNPLEQITVVEDPGKVALVMKAGKIAKSRLEASRRSMTASV